MFFPSFYSFKELTFINETSKKVVYATVKELAQDFKVDGDVKESESVDLTK